MRRGINLDVFRAPCRSLTAVALFALVGGCRYVTIGDSEGGLSGPTLPAAPMGTNDADAGDDEDAAIASSDAATPSLGQVSLVTAGYEHTCATTTTGAAYCWGGNTHGQLGDGSTTDQSEPVAVKGLSMGVTAVTAGYAHTCAIAMSGAVYCWGANASGQLGDGTTVDRSTPALVTSLRGAATAIAAGGSHTCAVTARGVSCWGGNADGQLGNGSTTDSTTPVTVTGVGAGITSVTAGGAHTCALESGGTIVCWGFDADGQLGNGATTPTAPPGPVSGISGGATGVCAGNVFSCALVGGAVQCWGFGELGQIGNDVTETSSVPAAVSGMGSGVVKIATGGSHACGIGPSGTVWCWGDDESGQLGNGDPAFSEQTVAVQATGVSGATALAGGGAHTCVVAMGRVLCWGWNVRGQLGDATQDDSLAPVEVSGF